MDAQNVEKRELKPCESQICTRIFYNQPRSKQDNKGQRWELFHKEKKEFHRFVILRILKNVKVTKATTKKVTLNFSKDINSGMNE